MTTMHCLTQSNSLWVCLTNWLVFWDKPNFFYVLRYPIIIYIYIHKKKILGWLDQGLKKHLFMNIIKKMDKNDG